jgi:hypothetical protein
MADISALHTRRLSEMGIDCINVPFGSASDWYADLELERDIDVLWIGSHGSWRRSRELERIGEALARRNIRFQRIDGRSAPFVHGADRTHILNRTKIVLNVMRTPYDDNTLRHFIAMPNRALVVSEPMLRHNTDLVPGIHYIEAPLPDLADAIEHYLQHDAERKEFVDRAHAICTGELVMQRMIQRILSAVSERV